MNDKIGLYGWAIDPDNPARQVVVQLHLGGHVIAETPTQHPRPDVARHFNVSETGHGFVFGPNLLLSLEGLTPAQKKQVPQVRIKGSKRALEGGALIGTLEWCIARFGASHSPVDARRRYQLLDQRLLTSLRQAQTRLDRQVDGPEVKSRGTLDFFARLGHGIQVVTAILPTTLEPGHYTGYVETQAGLHPAGVVFLKSRARQSGSPTCFGVLRTTRLVADVSQGFSLTLDVPGGAVRLEMKPGGRCQGPYSALSEMERQLASDTNGDVPSDEEIFIRRLCDWRVPGDASDLQFALDRIHALVDFGVFLEGWMLPTHKAIERIDLCVDDQVISVDLATLINKPRPDLHAIAGAQTSDLRIAGFMATADAAIQLQRPVSALIRFAFSDGTRHVGQLDAEALNPRKSLALLTELAAVYDDMNVQTFRPRFEQALSHHARNPGRLTSFRLAPASKNLLMELPKDRNDCTLVLSQLDLMRRAYRGAFGITLIMDDLLHKALVDVWAHAMRANFADNISVVRVEGDHVFPLADVIAQQVGAERVLYCARNFMPLNAGIEQLLTGYLPVDDPGLALQAQIGDTRIPSIGLWLGSTDALSKAVVAAGGRLHEDYLLAVFEKLSLPLFHGGVSALGHDINFDPLRESAFANAHPRMI